MKNASMLVIIFATFIFTQLAAQDATNKFSAFYLKDGGSVLFVCNDVELIWNLTDSENIDKLSIITNDENGRGMRNVVVKDMQNLIRQFNAPVAFYLEDEEIKNISGTIFEKLRNRIFSAKEAYDITHPK